MKFAKGVFLALILVMGIVTSAMAQQPAIDYLGYAWETGGFPGSVAGDLLVLTGVAITADPIFEVDLGTVELTFHVHGLVSNGDQDIGGGNTMINYSAGFLDIYVDAANNADYGVNPPSAVSPGTFTDGELFFHGSFDNFTMFMTSAGSGSYEGVLTGLGGTMIDGACSGCAYTWGGSFLTSVGALIPEGYDLQMDGVFEIEAAVESEDSTWDAVKSLYR